MGLFERIIEGRARGRAGAFKYALRNDEDVPASIGVDVGHSRHAVAMCPRYGLESFAIEGPLLAAEHNSMGPLLDGVAAVSDRIDRARDALVEGRIYDAEHHLDEARDTLDRLDASSADMTGMAL